MGITKLTKQKRKMHKTENCAYHLEKERERVRRRRRESIRSKGSGRKLEKKLFKIRKFS
jgi:hypothetical protein